MIGYGIESTANEKQEKLQIPIGICLMNTKYIRKSMVWNWVISKPNM